MNNYLSTRKIVRIRLDPCNYFTQNYAIGEHIGL